MFTKLRQWIDERWPLSSLIRLGLDEDIPGGSSFAYSLGSATLIVFLIQAVTGIWQIFYYVPTVDHAYDSLDYIRTSVPFGWLIHGLHYWGASAMIVLIVLHLARVFIWGAYKRPREITWLAGVLLLLVTLGMSFTGAPLPWDERGYWAAEVGTSIASNIPLIGDFAKRVLLGGSTMGQLTLSRFFNLHVLLLPAGLLAIIGIHLIAFRRAGSVGPWDEKKRVKVGKFWPNQVLKDAIVGVLMLLFLIGLAVYAPPPFSGPADPVDTTYVPKPEWNFLFLYEALKFFPGKLEPIGTIGIPMIGILLLVLVPFLDRNRERKPSRRPYAMVIGSIVGLALAGLTVAGFLSNPAAAGATTVSSTPTASSVVGKSSSVNEGAKLFQSLGCSGCHRVNGSGGTAGPDLSLEASRGRSRDWLITQIQDPTSHDPNTGMPAFSTLNDQQLNQLADYLLSLGVSASQSGSEPNPTAQMQPTSTVTTTAAVQFTPTNPPEVTASGTSTVTVTNSSEGRPPGPAADVIGSATHGSVLFTNECESCHGPQGKVGVPNPGSADGSVPPLNPIDPQFSSSDPQIFADNIDRIIQHGSTPDGPNPKLVMPAFGDTNTLTQQEIADIEAYIMQLNHVDRAQLIDPGMQPEQFFRITLAVFVVTASALLFISWFRRSS